MDRRSVLAVVAASATALALHLGALHAQQNGKVFSVGVLVNTDPMVGGKPNPQVAYGGPPTNAARKSSTTIPIVVVLVADPVVIGVATTLERPGGNITGVTVPADILKRANRIIEERQKCRCG